MTPPPEYAAVHPHLLLVLENSERMFASAAEGDRDAYRRHRRIVHDEIRVMTELLQAQGRIMPTISLD
jgi:hypothetical protein